MQLKSWYLAAVKPNMQRKADIGLQQQGVEVYAPQLASNDGHTVKVEPAFPTYLFVRFDPDKQSAGAINNTPGVRQLVQFGAGPAVVQDSIIEWLKTQFDDQEVDTRLLKGDKVIISDGPFAGIEAVFQETNGFRRSLLLVKLIGKTHRVEVSPEEISRL